MRFYPRSAKTRADALLGPGHIGNHGEAQKLTQADTLKRYKPGIDLGTVRKEYGGTV